jgi:hypothetical protein
VEDRGLVTERSYRSVMKWLVRIGVGSLIVAALATGLVLALVMVIVWALAIAAVGSLFS